MAARLRSIFVLRKLSLKTLQRFRWSFPLLFLLLAAVNFNSLTAPPFWDDLIGVQTQSVFLARCRLDVSALFSSPREAGSACYNPISILSWFYAILYLLLPPAAVHSAGHLLNCACLAGAGGLFLELTRRRFPPGIAVTGVFLALVHPLLASRGAAMGQEALLAFFIMLTLFLWSRDQRRKALVCALCSLTVKLTGAILLPGMMAELLVRTSPSGKRKKLLYSIGAGTAFLSLAGLYFLHFGSGAKLLAWKPAEVRDLLKNAYCLLLPEFLFALVLLGLTCPAKRKKMFETLHLGLFIWTTGFFYTANFLSGQCALPRYGAIIVFPTVFVLLSGLRFFTRRKAMCILGAMIFLNLVCCTGFLLPPIPRTALHDGSLLERSFEFTELRRKYQRFCAELEQSPPQSPLVVTWPLLHMLTVPEFGYVRSPVPNIVSGEYPHPLGNFRKLDRDLVRRGVMVLFEPNCYNWQIPRGAKILYASVPQDPLCSFLIYALP